MNTTRPDKIIRRIRILLILCILGLVFGFQMVLFVRPEITWLNSIFGPGTQMDRFCPSVSAWVNHLAEGINDTYARYPFIAYCMDWLALAQLGFIVMFIGAVINPVRNIWVIQCGLVVCLLHIATA
ncbi:MAG: hypothetical protein JW709_02600, partial [Sedimentisphaerales bacterium]|nr:hypothetical protein [Sedimentisphaerales bacterium]